MYYMEFNSAKGLFNKNILNNPSNYLNLVHNNKEFKGYNEIDFSFTLSETSNLKENFIFNLVKKKNDNYISRLYNPDDLTYITFEKDSNIFIEMKSSLKRADVDEITNKLINMSQRFSNAYKNTAYANLDKIFSKNNISYFLFYDDNRIDLFNKAIGDVKIDKEVEICYSSVNASISSIVSLQNQIRSQNDKLSKLQDEFKRFKETQDLNNSIVKIRMLNVSEKSIRDIIDKFIKQESIGAFNIFQTYNNLFIESSNFLKKIIPPDDIIILNDQIIGQKEIPPNYDDLINLLENKIDENTFAKDFYVAYRNALLGKEYVETNGAKCIYPIFNEKMAEMFKNFLKFICLLDKDTFLLNSFYGAILYYAIALSENDNTYERLYYDNFKTLNIKSCVIYLIQSATYSFVPQTLKNE